MILSIEINKQFLTRKITTFRGFDSISKLKYSMNQLTRSYGRSSSPLPPDHRTRQECLGIFRELTLNEPEMVYQQKFDSHSNEKVEGAFWSGVFYKEVELYRQGARKSDL